MSEDAVLTPNFVCADEAAFQETLYRTLAHFQELLRLGCCIYLVGFDFVHNNLPILHDVSKGVNSVHLILQQKTTRFCYPSYKAGPCIMEYGELPRAPLGRRYGIAFRICYTSRMFKSKKIVTLVPLRGGSKSIPYKNIKDLGGKPLCFWVLKAATEAKHIDEVWVSTEDKKIKDTVLSLGLGVKVLDRPPEFATDTSSTESVMLHFASQVGFDMLNLIQATSPLITSEDLDKAIEQFFTEGDDSLLSGVLHKKFFWTSDGKPLNYDYAKRPRRQDFAGVVHENGAFYLTAKDTLLKNQNRLGGRIGIFLIPEERGIDIDEPVDWPVAEEMLKNRQIEK